MGGFIIILLLMRLLLFPSSRYNLHIVKCTHLNGTIWSVLTNTYTSVNLCHDPQYHYHPRKLPCASSQSWPQKQPLFCFLKSQIRFACSWNSHKWNHAVPGFFFIYFFCFLYLAVFLWFTHNVGYLRSSFLLQLNSIPWYVYTTVCLSCSTVDEYLSCSQVLTFVNNVAVNIHK